MSLRLEMLQVARLAPRLLGDATPLIEAFVRGRLDPAGGFADRDGAADLYYTVFGLDCLHGLGAEVPAAAVAPFLRSHRDGEGLDLVHLGCLARCWAALPEGAPHALRRAILDRLEAHRTADGGFSEDPTSRRGDGKGTVYGGFVGFGATQDLAGEGGDPIPGAEAIADRVAEELAALLDPEGGAVGVLTTPVVAASITLLRHLHRPVPEAAGEWLFAQLHAQGGFLAVPGAPMPDLLSTATALHALAALERSPTPGQVEACLDFVDSLWTNRGAFHGHWADDDLDCEYTFYGLLALGHLAVLDS